MEKGKVVIGLSGGVDSTVAAYLLKKDGYEVIGVTLDLWESSNGERTIIDAKRVAEKLEIPHHIISLKEEFKDKVVEPFMDCYFKGLTPNPCVICNRGIKFEALLATVNEMGGDYIATGHYARIEKHPETGRLAIKDSATAKKDQTYALYRLSQEQLGAMLLPIGIYEKEEIRKIAEEIDAYIAQKKDSQDICFIPDGDYTSFIMKESKGVVEKGDFIDLEGVVLGQHNGLIHYTVGQRKGLGIAFGTPKYVYGLDAKKNQVILCEDKELFQNKLQLGDLANMAVEKFEEGMRFQGKIRYSHKKAWCTIKVIDENTIECIFDEPQRAITPGQSVVLYHGEFIAGGGIILPIK